MTALADISDIFRDLLKTENHGTLWGLIALALALLALLLIAARLGYLKVSLRLPWMSVEPGGAKAGADGDMKSGRRYRKLLYVKVTYLSDQARAAAPAYHRTVERLKEADRAVPVFDEAVYYTLELFPKKGPVGQRRDRSSGVVDSRVVLPWRDEIDFLDADARFIKETVPLESTEDTDTFLTISHFENGLQGPVQNIGTDVPEDAEFVRLLVDFSSIPDAPARISATKAVIRSGRDEVLAQMSQPAPGLYSVLCTDIQKDSLIKILFAIGPERGR